LSRDRDGIPRVGLNEGDRRALGWFELELHAAREDRKESGIADAAATSAQNAVIHEFVGSSRDTHEQLELSLGIERQG
jgi:hypothetical protein